MIKVFSPKTVGLDRPHDRNNTDSSLSLVRVEGICREGSLRQLRPYRHSLILYSDLQCLFFARWQEVTELVCVD